MNAAVMEGKTMLIMYHGYTLVPVGEEAKSRVKVFSRSNFVVRTRNYADDESAMAEAKKLVDAILYSRQCGRPVALPHDSPAPPPLPSRTFGTRSPTTMAEHHSFRFPVSLAASAGLAARLRKYLVSSGAREAG